MSPEDQTPSPTTPETLVGQTPVVRIEEGLVIEVRIAQDVERIAAERESARLGKAGLLISFLSLLAAGSAGLFVYQQFKEMAAQTDLLARAARQARLDSNSVSITTSRQLDLLRGQLGQQRRALELDQRPWLKIEMDVVNSARGGQAAGQPLIFAARITNSGKTTAEHLKMVVFVQLIARNREPAFPRFLLRQFRGSDRDVPQSNLLWNKVPPDEELTNLLYPQESIGETFKRMRVSQNSTWSLDPLTSSESQAIARGDSYVVAYGILWYSDVFGIRHWTKFCQNSVAVSSKCIDFGGVDPN